MKPKGISILELHVEKIVLGAAGLIVIGLAGWTFFVDHNSVTVEGAARAPAQVDAVLYDRARQIQGRMQSGSTLEIEEGRRLTEWFEQAMAAPTVPATTTPMPLVRAPILHGAPGEIAGLSGGAEVYAEVLPPAPTGLVVVTTGYSLDSEAVAEIEELATQFDSGLFDMHAVHALAEFNGKALRSALAAPQADRRAIPSPWFENDMMILDVVLERQEQGPDGSWSSPQVVPPPPGIATVRDRLLGASPAGRDEILSEAALLGMALYQPPFYTLADGVDWSVEMILALGPKSPELITAERRMMRAWDRFQRAEDSLRRFEERQSTTGTRPSGGDLEHGSDRPRPSPREREPGQRETLTPQERVRQQLQQDIEDARKEYERLRESVLELEPAYTQFPDEAAPRQARSSEGDHGHMSEGEHGGMIEGTSEWREGVREHRGDRPSAAGRPTGLIRLFEEERIRVWAHDVTVTPGSTYRYRLKVGLFNPFFGREGRLVEAQRPLAQSLLLSSEATEWSDPVRVAAQQQFYTVRGNYHDDAESRIATFEVYTFAGGQHHMREVSVRPGDSIGDRRQVQPRSGEAPLEVDFSTGVVLLDVLPLEGPTAGINQRVAVVVAMPDGTVRVLDPERQAQDPERVRLREQAVRG